MANSQCPIDIDHGDKLQTVLETASGLAAVCFNVECPSNFAFFEASMLIKKQCAGFLDQPFTASGWMTW